MAEKFLSARVPEELKRVVKTIATQKDQSVQDFVGEIVVAYLNNLQQESKVAGLGAAQQAVVNSWAEALFNRDPAAQSVFEIMELWHDNHWRKATSGNQPGGQETRKDIG